jgi:hypothetical protein
MASSSRLPMPRERKILKTSWHLAGGRTRVDIEGLTGLVSKLGRLRCGRMAEMEGMRHHVACVEVKQSHEGSVSVRSPDKMLDGFTTKGYLGCVLHVRAFWCFDMRLYIGSGLVLCLWEVLSFVCENGLLGFKRGREMWLFV